MASRSRRVFPLVPRYSMGGIDHGRERSRRRGQGADIAGSRPYRPGDHLASIDWHSSARLSAVQNDDVFVVREYYAELAPRVVVMVDRRPSMGLYSAELPWLRKPDVLREAITAIVAASYAARASVGYLEIGAVPYWVAPRRQSARQILQRLNREFDGPVNSMELAVDFLTRLRQDVPAGSFVFVISDFLRPPPIEAWTRLRARQLDVVPVIVQDPVWEQSFPLVNGLLIPVTDPETGSTQSIRLTEREAQERQRFNVARLRNIVSEFRRLQLDPVLLDTTAPAAIDLAFLNWAARRRRILGRAL
jgi:uncharacterized protein (DUF58 family)